jgi:hypothetical protein
MRRSMGLVVPAVWDSALTIWYMLYIVGRIDNPGGLLSDPCEPTETKVREAAGPAIN